MRRRHAITLALGLAVAGISLVAFLLLGRDRPPGPVPRTHRPVAPAPPPEPVAPAASPTPPAPVPAAREDGEADPTPEPPPLAGRRGGLRKLALDPDPEDGWKAYPEDAKGPVVVGIVVQYGESNPECSIALESIDDPKREDPSVLEDLPDGRFRLTGFVPGRYRVRAQADGALAAYSGVLSTEDGKVTDAGAIRLRRHGCIAGVVLDREGGETGAEVRLFGRDPENLGRKVVERARAVGRQGFQLSPHEAGEFTVAFESDFGWAVHSGKTDAAGLAWAVVPLKPWSSVSTFLEGRPGSAPDRARILRTTVEPLEVPDLGAPATVRSVEGGGPVGRLAAGSWRVSARWEGVEGDRREEHDFAKTVVLGEGEAAKVEVKR